MPKNSCSELSTLGKYQVTTSIYAIKICDMPENISHEECCTFKS